MADQMISAGLTMVIGSLGVLAWLVVTDILDWLGEDDE